MLLNQPFSFPFSPQIFLAGNLNLQVKPTAVPTYESGLNKGVYFSIRTNTPKTPGAPWLEVVENGGYATVTVQFIRDDGLFPFDPECDDFSRIAPGAPAEFYDDHHFALNYT